MPSTSILDQTAQALASVEHPYRQWLDYDFGSVPFERIRRITGYLVGTLDRFNNAKRAEESERVKHGL